ncbi:MAG TPA: hypothetical protein VJB70_04225 [Candidatus Paceibacterota bacterium]
MKALYLHTDTKNKQIIWLMAGVLLGAIFLYGYFVNVAILNIVMRQQSSEELKDLQSVVSELESRYSTLRVGITREHARTLGFVEPKSQTFVSEKRLVQATENAF